MREDGKAELPCRRGQWSQSPREGKAPAAGSLMDCPSIRLPAASALSTLPAAVDAQSRARFSFEHRGMSLGERPLYSVCQKLDRLYCRTPNRLCHWVRSRLCLSVWVLIPAYQKSSFLIRRYIFRISSSYTNVIRWRSRSEEQKDIQA